MTKCYWLKPIAIIQNSRAGKGRAGAMAVSAAAILDGKNFTYVIFNDEWPYDYSSYAAVWIFGGDGTLNYFINHAKGALPPLAIFKGGTGNDFATTLYGKAGLADMIEIVLNAQPKKIDVGVCNGQFFLNMTGIGFDGETLRNMSTIRWMGAFLGYYYAILKTIFSYKEQEYSISINGHPPYAKSFLLLFINNAPSAGGGFRVSPLSNPADGKLNLLLCEPLNIWKRLLKLSLIKQGKHMNESFITHELVDQVHIETSSPVVAQIDGELLYANRFNFTVIPGHFSFLY